MQTVPIQAIPQQTFTYIDPSNNTWSIGIRNVAMQMAFTFSLNGKLLIQNICAVAGYRIIPYDYLENGNFVLITQNFQLPDYTQFGTTQTLVFLSEADILAFRSPIRSLAQVFKSTFDPNGGLPLRFAPTGYIETLIGQYVNERGSSAYVIEDGTDVYVPENIVGYVTEFGALYVTEDATNTYIPE